MKFWKLCALLIMWLALVMLNAVPAQAKLFGEDNLKADFNGDGRIETVKLLRNSSNDGLRAALYDSAGNMLWISEENYFNKYTSCFVADIDLDKVPDLAFSGGYKKGRHITIPNEETVVLSWKNGKFSTPKRYIIMRSGPDTTIYLWCKDKADPLCEFGMYRASIYNLRRVGSEIWGDVLISYSDFAKPEDIVGQIRLVPRLILGDGIKRGFVGVESRGCCNAKLALMAFPYPMDTKLKADLTGDGKQETVSFNSYYPATGYPQFYQIAVSDEAGNTVWKSKKARRHSGGPHERNYTLGVEYSEIKPAEGGLSIFFDNKKGGISSGFISDIDGDGYKELVASTWARGGDRIEIWRWRDGAFHFVGKTRLMRSAADANTYLFVDPEEVDNDSRIYVKVNYNAELDYSSKDHISISNLRIRNGEIWGLTGTSGGHNNSAVKLKPCEGGFKVIESVPYDKDGYW